MYTEKSRPKNWTLWHPHNDCQRPGQQAFRFDTLNSIGEVVGEPGEAFIWETKDVESADKDAVIDRVEYGDEKGLLAEVFQGAFDSDEGRLFDRRPITDAGNEAVIAEILVENSRGVFRGQVG